jgi:hypothetical protein
LREECAEHEDAEHNTHDKTAKEVYKEYAKRKGVRIVVGDVVVDDIAQACTYETAATYGQ